MCVKKTLTRQKNIDKTKSKGGMVSGCQKTQNRVCVCVLKNIDKTKSKGGVVSYCQKFKTVCVCYPREKNKTCVCVI